MTIEVGTKVSWTETGIVTEVEEYEEDDGTTTLRWVTVKSDSTGGRWQAAPDEIEIEKE